MPMAKQSKMVMPAQPFDDGALRALLSGVGSGAVPIEEALQRLKHLPFEEMQSATLDHHRMLRKGFAEVIYCAGKTARRWRRSPRGWRRGRPSCWGRGRRASIMRRRGSGCRGSSMTNWRACCGWIAIPSRGIRGWS